MIFKIKKFPTFIKNLIKPPKFLFRKYKKYIFKSRNIAMDDNNNINNLNIEEADTNIKNK
jgi:hypothetical protein